MLTITGSTLRVTTKPTIAPIAITPGSGGAAALALGRHIDAVGSITFGGHPGDSAAGWQVGFLQAEWVETNWASYRGVRSTDGSSFVQRARAPARTQRACLDNAVASNPFYGSPTDPSYAPAGETNPLTNVVALPANLALPLTVKVYHYDKPADSFDLQRINSRTGQANLLHEVQMEFMFCAMLVARSPAGAYHFMKGFYWNARWQSTFRPVYGVVTAFPVARGNGCGIGQIFDGKPSDRRFRTVLEHPQHRNCNDVAAYAGSHPDVRETTTWQDFDVTH